MIGLSLTFAALLVTLDYYIIGFFGFRYRFVFTLIRSHAIGKALMSLPKGVHSTEQSCHPSAVLSVSFITKNVQDIEIAYMVYRIAYTVIDTIAIL